MVPSALMLIVLPCAYLSRQSLSDTMWFLAMCVGYLQTQTDLSIPSFNVSAICLKIMSKHDL